ncbi:MAG: aminoacetone oxidase family FAD-binding enzyme, partial [Heliobacteriaceae bacterium]|nr:aminoacetone oxidase family FAD-binding enzyme [Heliobacteriaceae bacterium]
AVLAGGRVVAQDRGDLLFTNYGISGPPILQISRKAGELLQDNQEPWLQVTLLDTLPPAALDRILQGRFAARPAKSLEFSLVGLINKRLIPVILKEAGVPDTKRPVAGVTTAERQRIVNQLTNWRFGIRGTKSWSSAQVTAGGIDTGGVNPDTMESNLVDGLYFAGEVLDIDGCCGGFNLQWAWSSGYVAGQAAGSGLA